MNASMDKLRAAAIGGIVVRNLVPVAGMLFLGWSAPYLLLLYYADTLASLATVFMLVFMYAKGLGVDASDPAQIPTIFVAVAGMTVAVGAVFGFPILLVSMVQGETFRDQDLRIGLLVQLLFGCVTFLTMSREMRRAADPEPLIKARLAFVMARWVAVFVACLTIPWGPLLVAVYAGASAWLEIRPPKPPP